MLLVCMNTIQTYSCGSEDSSRKQHLMNDQPNSLSPARRSRRSRRPRRKGFPLFGSYSNNFFFLNSLSANIFLANCFGLLSSGLLSFFSFDCFFSRIATSSVMYQILAGRHGSNCGLSYSTCISSIYDFRIDPLEWECMYCIPREADKPVVWTVLCGPVLNSMTKLRRR